jgi:signal transduction histidine kinase
MVARGTAHQNIFRVLTAGFGLVILFLVAAATFGLRSIQSIRQSVASLLREQSVTNGLIAELHSQQTSLSEVFSVLARDPDSLDFDGIMRQLDQADRDIERICAEGERTPESRLWRRLRQSSEDFSHEARRLLTAENVETYASIDLFRAHEAFVSVVARLIEAEYRKVSAAQAQIDQRSSRLFKVSLLFASITIVLGLVFAAITIGRVRRLTLAFEMQAAELGRVSWQMLARQEETARRFSHELHDELGQALTAIKTHLTALEAAGPAGNGRLEDCVRLVDDAIGNVRQMSQLLRPTILDDFGLEAGVRWLCEGFAARTGIDVDFRSDFTGRLPDETETHLFRIAQEALTNVARHSGAAHAQVRLQPAEGMISLSIRDDGRGMALPSAAPHPNGGGMGLIGMRARARSAGGDLTLRSKPGEGVVIEVRVPVPNEANSNPVG